MCDYIEREGHFEGYKLVVRELAICIRLIDIFMEDDAVHSTWLHKSFSGNLKFRKLENNLYELDETDRKPIADYPVYVNVRNERRFFRATPIMYAKAVGNRDKTILSTVSLRQQKALHLYHLIREYNLLTWWD